MGPQTKKGMLELLSNVMGDLEDSRGKTSAVNLKLK
jgi:hypothetical protein